MKLSWMLLMLALSMTSCVVDDYDHDHDDDDGDHVAVRTTGPVTTTHRRYISYSDTDPYYRVYYRDGDRAYYRQYYYDDIPAYSTRVDTRRYYYRTPASRASVQFGY
jgi:hypothetical protein